MGKLQTGMCPPRTSGQLVPLRLNHTEVVGVPGRVSGHGEWGELAGPRDHIGLSLS